MKALYLDTIKNSISNPDPNHVAIIMDGNGRWAQARNLPRTAGHKQGASAIRKTVEEAIRLGINYLTLFGFSVENWNRPQREIHELMGLLRVYLRNNVNELEEQGVCLKFIGNLSRLPIDTVRMIKDAEVRTSANHRLILTIALSYGSRQEIILAVKKIVDKVVQGEIDVDQITEDSFSSYLSTHDIPEPDLLIRTSGEQRLSNFLLWQMAYTELVFTEIHWPDFDELSLRQSVLDYKKRDRRYGEVSN